MPIMYSSRSASPFFVINSKFLSQFSRRLVLVVRTANQAAAAAAENPAAYGLPVHISIYLEKTGSG